MLTQYKIVTDFCSKFYHTLYGNKILAAINFTVIISVKIYLY